ncbi:isochorismatase family protein [Sphingomonas naphthae]|uniref:Isochorismatase family protein n=1 Tax=Sphingomonas naphthae TaxID=1813468 RepID=A0ABY7TMA5_9SPHN|nr:isochorismatase family protein [Sphingomonas naphthae]WCT74345.1 isochorismatase family protein [Sphingomonas naphthae]
MPDDLDTDYAAAGFGGRLAFGRRPVLLIVDVVMAYLDPACPLYAGVEDALASNERLAAAARTAGVPVIFTNIEYDAGGADGGMFFKKVPALKAFLKGSPDGAFPPTLQPEPGEMIVSKKYPSAFFATPLASTLHAMQVDTVLLTGYSTSGCVRASALDALCHGFAPFVIREACGDRDARPHEQNLFDMAAKMAEVISEADAIAAMRVLAK